MDFELLGHNERAKTFTYDARNSSQIPFWTLFTMFLTVSKIGTLVPDMASARLGGAPKTIPYMASFGCMLQSSDAPYEFNDV